MTTEPVPLNTRDIEEQLRNVRRRYDHEIYTEEIKITDSVVRQIAQRGIPENGVKEGAGGLCGQNAFSLALFGDSCNGYNSSEMEELRLTRELLTEAFAPEPLYGPEPFADAETLRNRHYNKEVAIHYPAYGYLTATALYAILLSEDENVATGHILLPVITISSNIDAKEPQPSHISYGIQRMLAVRRQLGEGTLRFIHPRNDAPNAYEARMRQYEAYDFLKHQLIGRHAINSAFDNLAFSASRPAFRVNAMLSDLYDYAMTASRESSNPYNPKNLLCYDHWDPALTDYFRSIR